MLAIPGKTARLLFVASFLVAGAKGVSPQTLKETLAASKLPAADARLANLEKKITSGAQLDDADQFVIAYYLEDASGELNPPLFIDRYDKKSKEWQSAALPDAQTKGPSVDDVCFGAILDIQSAGGRFLLETHINPSAGCLLVLSPDLKLEADLDGWLLGQLGGNLLVYRRSEVHFAAVHPAEIALYDLRSKRDAVIFPPKTPTPIREARTIQLREFFKSNEAWCQKNDDSCDSESFDSDLQGPAVLSEADSAVALLISYEQIQLVEGELQKPSGPNDVLYVYRRLDDPAKTEFREMLLSEAKTRFGDMPLQNLLQPEMLQKIFAEASTKGPNPGR
jgi:hypothetical protein